MPTSLAEQLVKLRTPQTSLIAQDKRKPSLLYDTKVAATLDRKTVFEIGKSGLIELIKLNGLFKNFEKVLFDESSVDLERSVWDKKVNQKLDDEIKKILVFLSPYFQLNHAHRVLEWLIHRFHIHQFNKDQFILLILPYHSSRIFVRALQILDLSTPSDKWHWLYSFQKSRAPLITSLLINRLVSDNSLVKLICNHIVFATDTYGDYAISLNTLYDFYAASLLGLIEKSETIDDVKLNYILPSLLKGLSNKISDFAASSYAIFAKIITKVNLRDETIDTLLSKCLKNPKLKQDIILLLIFFYDNNFNNYSKISEKLLLRLLKQEWLIDTIKEIKEQKVGVAKFLSLFIESALMYLKTNNDNNKIKSQVQNIFNEISYEDNEVLIILQNTLTEKLIDNENSNELNNFIANLYYCWEIKYPESFDKFLQDLMLVKETNNCAYRVLQFLMSWDCKKRDVSESLQIFTKLNHSIPEQRVAAIELIGYQNFTIPSNLKEMVNQSLLERFNDERNDVINALLRLPITLLQTFFKTEILIDNLLNLLKRCYNPENKELSLPVIKLLLKLAEDGKDIRIFLAILPYLFPIQDAEVEITLQILNSKFAKANAYLKTVFEEINNSQNASHIRSVAFHNILIPNLLPDTENLLTAIKKQTNENAVTTFFNLIILGSVCRVPVGTLSCKLARESIELAANFVKNFDSVQPIKDATQINAENFNDALQFIYRGVLPLQATTYVYEMVHRRLDLNVNSKLDFENDAERSNLVVRIIEIYFESMLLQSWRKEHNYWVSHYQWCLKIYFQRHFRNVEDVITFLSQFFVKPVKSETSLLCLKMSLQLLSDCKSFKWVFNNSMFVVNLLISLNSDDFSCRKIAVDILKTISLSFNLENNGLAPLLFELSSRHSEILIDNQQLSLFMYILLSPDPDVTCQLKLDLRNKLKIARDLLFKAIIENEIPIQMSSQLLKILIYVNGPSILKLLTPYASSLLDNIKKSKVTNEFKHCALKSILKRFNESSVEALENKDTKQFFFDCIIDYKTIIAVESTNQSVSTIIIKQIDSVFYNKLGELSEKLQQELFAKLIDIGTDCEIDAVLSVVTKIMKQIAIDAQLVVNELKSMTDLDKTIMDKKTPAQKRRLSRLQNQLGPEVLNSRKWKRGVTLLQFIQDSNNVENEELLVPALFDLLRKCLQIEEQSSVEYTNQLILSIIHQLSIKSIPIKDADSYVDMIAQCIRTSQNPQTHHHALLVLVELFKLADPQSALQNMMPIFTFIGNSVLRQDDAYSIQIITKTIDVVLPVINAGKNIKYAAEILRLFITSLPDIPEHRRIPLFLKLLQLLDNYLYLYYILTFENHVLSGNTEQLQKQSSQRLDFALLISQNLSVNRTIEMSVKIVQFLKDLPVEIDPQKRNTNVDKYMFDLSNFTPKLLRYCKYTTVKFLVSFLSAQDFINRVAELDEEEIESLVPLCNQLIVEIIIFIQSATKFADLNQNNQLGKYWKVMLHFLYDVLDLVNNLLPNGAFISGIKELIQHDLFNVRRKALEILNIRLQQKKFGKEDYDDILTLMDPLVKVLDGPNKFVNPELETIQQTALISLKLLAKLLANENPEIFKPILNLVTGLIKKREGPVLASAVLCIAELCSSMKVHVLQYLNKFVPQIIQLVKKHIVQETPDIIAISILSALQKIVESIGNFLSVYLHELFFELSRLMFQYNDSDNPKVGVINSRLKAIVQKLTNCTPLRILLPAINKTYEAFLKNNLYSYISPLMHILSESFVNIQASELAPLITNFINFFLKVLQFREEVSLSEGEMEVDGEATIKDVAMVEESASKALVALVLKLSESTFRPLYYKLYDWAARNPQYKQRNITFYRLSANIAECLKSLFVLFAGHFLKHASSLLNANNITYYTNEKSDMTLPNEASQIEVIEEILLTFLRVFSYDSHDFVNKERFDTLMQPLIAQIENTIGSWDKYEKRAKDLIVPCIASFAGAISDDSLHKQLVYQVLLKTRHVKPYVRSCALSALVEIARKLGEDFMPLLPETVPFLAELLEDEDEKTEKHAQNSVRTLEEILGEPLQKYF